MNKIINWMGGWPKDGLVPASEWEERLAAAAERLRRESSFLSARPGSGERLKAELAQGLLRGKAKGQEERLRLGMGADAILTGLAERTLQPGNKVLTERLTSRSALQAFRKQGVRVEEVEGDGRGMDPDALREAIRLHRPMLVYVSPVCADPSGAIWPKDRLDAVVRVCQEAEVCLIRDDRQEMLIYEDLEEPGRLTLEPVPPGVVSIGQLPPGLVAGLRFGWAAGPPDQLDRWFPSGSCGIEMADPGVTPLERAALTDLLQEHPLEPLIDMLRVQCRERMRRLTGLLKQRSGAELRWRDPGGGIHLWLTLPEGLDGEAMLRGAWLKGFMFQPGAPFFVSRPQRNTIRLTFAFADEKQMKTGVARLYETMEDFLGRYDRG